MAQTIQLKHSYSTGSWPTGLADGEVAINLADHKMWIGSGSASSSALNLESFSASHLDIRGHHTTSGDISSSGNIYANRLFIGLENITTAFSPLAGNEELVTVGNIENGTWTAGALTPTVVVASAYLDADTAHLTTDQTFTGKKTFSAAVTASDHISSSANVYSANNEALLAASFKYTSLQDGYYGMPGNAGINTAVWAYEKTDGATGLGATSQHIGIRVPYKCVLVGMMGNIRSDTASATVNMSCWTCELTNNTDNTWTKSFETTDITTAASTNKVMGYSDLTGTAILAAGTSVIPAILNDQGGTSTLFGSYTIVIRRII